MRIVKRCYLLFLFSTALLLVCGQLPELLTLIDDTSNDFVEESLVTVSPSTESAPVPARFQRSVIFKEESNRTTAIIPSTRSAPSFSPELLRLFTIQRK